MKRPRLKTLGWVAAIALAASVAASPWLIAGYSKLRSSNPVRRGVAHAIELGCFSCHGELGREGIPIPGSHEGVPRWNQSVWMMYVGSDEEVRSYIADGSAARNDAPHADADGSEHAHDPGAVLMPAYGDRVSESELDDLVAAFKVLPGMVAPERGTAARAYAVATSSGSAARQPPAAPAKDKANKSLVGMMKQPACRRRFRTFEKARYLENAVPMSGITYRVLDVVEVEPG